MTKRSLHSEALSNRKNRSKKDKSMKLKLFLTGLCLLLSLHDPIAAGGSEAAAAQQAAPAAKDDREQVLLHKRLGDHYASQGDHGKAADEFELALSLDSAAFTRDERVRMATVLSWAKRFDAAIAVLRPVVAEDPKNHDARIQLARVLSWSGKQGEAEKEADLVLAEVPDSPEALLVKANILRWKGDAAAAAPLYRKGLEGKEDFDARLGLAHAYLATGDARAAQEAGALLKPVSVDQEKDLSGLIKALCAAKTANAGAQYSRYRDSDLNLVDRYSLSSGLRAGNSKAELGYRLTEAHDPVQDKRSQDVWLNDQFQAGGIDAAMGAGLYLPGDSGAFATGYVRAKRGMGRGSLSIGASREALAETAQLIEGKILRSTGGLSLSQDLSGGLTFSGNYIRSIYSDDNNSDDILVTAQKGLLHSGPQVDAEYRFRYLDFRRQSLGGYFDPEDFTAHRLSLSLKAERGRLHVHLEPSFGFLSYTRYGEKIRMVFTTAVASAEWKVKNCIFLEINAQGGNYAAAATTGFAYNRFGIGLKASF
jgi:Tfp pilus assembly protein PilF